jgi:hypothetical protein
VISAKKAKARAEQLQHCAANLKLIYDQLEMHPLSPVGMIVNNVIYVMNDTAEELLS